MQIQYRPEIDGLRAISVIGVIIFHLDFYIVNFKILPGGFIGVDIFFVISGFLITSLILKEIKNTGKFSYLNFYERRARRILPILFFTIFVSFPLGWIFLLGTDFIEFSKSVLHTLFFISNYYFYISETNYWTQFNLKEFHHTWSLAVEEQFYFVFPLIYIACIKFFKKYVIHITILGILLSFLLAAWASTNYASINFYSLPTRGWELLSGALLAKLDQIYIRNKKNKFDELIAFIGLLTIIFSFILFNESIKHPSYFTLFPIIGTMFVLWFANDKGLTKKILSNKILVFAGLISYSLYILHYPLIAFAEVNQMGIFYKITFAICLFLLSSLTYLYIEKPFRNRNIVSKLLFYKILFTSFIILILLYYIVIINHGFKNRWQLNDIYTFDNTSYLIETSNFEDEDNAIKYKNANKKNVLIIGNSHGRDLYNSLKLNEDIYYDLEFAYWETQIECIDNYINLDKNCNWSIDEKYDYNTIDYLFNNAEVFLLSTRWSDNDIDELNIILPLLKNFNKKIIITTNTNEYPTYKKYFGSLLIVDNYVYKNKEMPTKKQVIEIEKEYFLKKNLKKNNSYHKKYSIDQKNNLILKIAKENKISAFEMNDILCDNETKRCEFFDPHNIKIYHDYGHFTLSGAKYIGKKIRNNNWFVSNN